MNPDPPAAADERHPEPWFSRGKELTRELLELLLPGRMVGDFALRFYLDRPATLTAEILLTETEAGGVIRLLIARQIALGRPVAPPPEPTNPKAAPWE